MQSEFELAFYSYLTQIIFYHFYYLWQTQNLYAFLSSQGDETVKRAFNGCSEQEC